MITVRRVHPAAVTALAVAALLPLSSLASAAPAAALGTIATPADRGLASVPDGTLTARITLAPGARISGVRLNGVTIRPALSASGRTVTARIPDRQPLRAGANVLSVAFRAARRSGVDAARFTLVRPATGQVRIASPAAGARVPARPLPVSVRAVPGAQVRLWVNDREASGRLQEIRPGQLRALIGPSAGLRYGTNRLRVRAVRRSGRIQDVSRTVTVGTGAPLADAGADVRTTAGVAVRLDGRATLRAPGTSQAPASTWTIAGGPPGSSPRLTGARTARPTLQTDKPGTYALRVTVRGPGGKSGAERAEAATGTSSDTVTVAAQAPGPLIAVGAATSPSGTPGITVGGTTYAATIPGPGIQVVVLERATAGFVSTTSYPTTDLAELASDMSELTSTQGSDVLVLMASLPGGPAVVSGQSGSFGSALTAIGVAPGTSLIGPFGIAGIPGSPAGTASTIPAALDGFLTVDVNGNYTFTFGDYIPFDTATPDPSAGVGNVVTVGGTTFAVPAPPPGQGGFQVVTLDPLTLDPACEYYATNGTQTANCTVGGLASPAAPASATQSAAPATGATLAPPINQGGPGPACGPGTPFPCPQEPQLQEMAEDLQGLPPDGVVIITTVCTPAAGSTTCGPFSAPGADWVSTAFFGNPLADTLPTISALGGTVDVFAQLGAADTYTLVSPPPAGQNPFERSTLITGPGTTNRLAGVLARGADGSFAPILADFTGQIDFAANLASIAYQPSTPWPAGTSGGQLSALQAITRRLGLCVGDVCDVRAQYANQSITLPTAQLQGLTYPSPAPAAYTEADFTAVKRQLLTEFGYVADTYSFIDVLQAPYPSATATGSADLQSIAAAVEQAVTPPSNTGVASVLSIATDVLWALSLVSGTEAIDAVAEVAGEGAVAAAFGSDLADGTDGSPVTQVEAAATSLALDWVDQIQAVSTGIGNLGQIVVTDWGKLSAVATRTKGPWAVDQTVRDAMQSAVETGATQTFWQALMPVAYTPYTFVPTATNPPGTTVQTYLCASPQIGPPLFAPFNQAPAQSTVALVNGYGLPTGTGTTATTAQFALYEAGQTPLVGANSTSFPPASIVDPLFAPVTQQGGIGVFGPWFWTRVYLGQSPAQSGSVLPSSVTTVNCNPDPGRQTIIPVGPGG
ncbi:MAG: hypothetical protein MUE51_06625 [Thermoleophilia bacterium]|nr:hypothetical protein [Thermoleophilia bacterium]